MVKGCNLLQRVVQHLGLVAQLITRSGWCCRG